VAHPNSSNSSKRGGRSRPALSARGVVRVDPDFADEYPEADARSTEVFATLVRAGDALWAELDRRIALTFGISQNGALTLAVIDGAGKAITPSEISERLLISSATMTSTLDSLEQRGFIRRAPNPDDRRSLLIEITNRGRATADKMIPGIHKVERRVLAALTQSERTQLLKLLDKVLAGAAEVAAEEPERLEGRRVRPARLH
jgi:DNA-binding MarR family transcriptional regulator